jgi:hypothetical protein
MLRLLPIFLAIAPIGHFQHPVYVTSPPHAKHTLIVAERSGRIRSLVRGHRRTYADLRSRVIAPAGDEETDQRGLFSIAFPPKGGGFYVDYVDRASHQRIDFVRGTRVRPVLDLGEVGRYHHGGQLQFGPDGLLYASTGDGGDGVGQILRFDPLDPHPEVYATGLRNPWRFSFHKGTLLIGDVGDSTWEEVDVVPRGAAPGTDFGWPAIEGPGGVGGVVSPALVHNHHDGWCAITGGYVVRGRYVYGDLCTGKLWSARLTGAALSDDRPLKRAVPYLTSFGKDARGRLYAVSFSGEVYRLSPPARARSRPSAAG